MCVTRKRCVPGARPSSRNTPSASVSTERSDASATLTTADATAAPLPASTTRPRTTPPGCAASGAWSSSAAAIAAHAHTARIGRAPTRRAWRGPRTPLRTPRPLSLIVASSVREPRVTHGDVAGRARRRLVVRDELDLIDLGAALHQVDVVRRPDLVVAPRDVVAVPGMRRERAAVAVGLVQ